MSRLPVICARWVLVVAVLAVFSIAGIAQAQEKKAPSDWTFQVTPYLWLSGISGDVTAPNGDSASFDASIGDVLNHLDGGLMLLGEAEYRKRWILLADFDYARISASGQFGPFLGVPSVEVKEYLGTLEGGYRIVNSDSFKLDGLVGVRVISIDTSLNFSGAILAPRTDNANATWADPVVAVRGMLPIGPKFFASGYGDVGGGPDGDLTWQLWGGFGYNFNEAIAAYVGYRYLALNHQVNNLNLSLDMGGPLIGVGIRF